MGLPNWRAFLGVFGGMAPGSGGEAEQLRGDADATFVEGLDGDLVALADFAEDVGGGDAAVVEEKFAGGRGADAELVFLLADRKAGRIALDEEGGDALVAGAGIDGGEDDEEAGFGGVGDPELAAVEEVVVAVGARGGGEGEGVGTGACFGERVGADGVGCHARKVLLLLGFGAPAKEGVYREGVLYVDEDADGGVDGRDFFDSEDGAEERAADAAIFFGNFDAHEAEVKKPRN